MIVNICVSQRRAGSKTNAGNPDAVVKNVSGVLGLFLKSKRLVAALRE